MGLNNYYESNVLFDMRRKIMLILNNVSKSLTKFY